MPTPSTPTPSPRIMAIPVVATLALLLMLGDVHASPASVNIHNGVGEQVALHCWSGRDILKPQAMWLPNGHRFGFGFTPSVLGNTRYVCRFAWGPRTATVAVWVDRLFLKVWKHRPCTHCEWHVNQTGFYRLEFAVIPRFIRPWN